MENHSPEGVDEQRTTPDLAPAAEQRDDPTSEDWKVAQGLKELKGAVSQVKADQLMDPDNKTDPDDAAVSAALDEVEAAVDKAIVAQGQDKKWEPDETKSGKDWATAKRAFSSFIERPPAQTGELQVRMGDGDDSMSAQFRGYAYTINERYGVTDWLGVYNERIGPGASSKTLREQDSIPMLRNHDANFVFANTRSGTSQLADDGRGLLNLADLDRRQTYTNDTCISLQRGDLAKMSFSFRAINEDWNEAYDDRLVRELQLYDTSIVTYPANPATSAELVDSMRSALGREGRSLWLADGELSIRSALPIMVEHRSLPVDEGDDLLERAVKALAHADEVLCRSHGPHGRARTFHVAGSLMELRAGKALSAKNQGLLKSALDALSAADKQHAKLADSHAKASGAISDALATNDADANADLDGKGHNTPPGNGNLISPQDGAGPRSAALKLQRQREAEVRALRRR